MVDFETRAPTDGWLKCLIDSWDCQMVAAMESCIVALSSSLSEISSIVSGWGLGEAAF